MSPNGMTCWRVTFDRASMRRSLAATSRNLAPQHHAAPDSVVKPACPAVEDDLARGQGAGVVELVRGEQHRPVFDRSGPHDGVEDLAARRVEAGVRFVEEQQAGITRERHRQRQPPTLPGGETTVDHVVHPREPESLEGGVGVGGAAARGAGGEAQVLADGQIVVTEGLVTHEREVATGAAAVLGEIVAEHRGLPGVERHQPGQEPQQGGLPGTVRPREQDDLAAGDVEIDTGQRGKAPQEADGRAETDDDRHTRLRAVDGQILRRGAGGGRTGGPAWAGGARPDPSVSLGSHAQHARCGRPRVGRHRDPPAAVRRLPALGHRDLPGPGPGQPPEPVRADPADAGALRPPPRRPRPRSTLPPGATTTLAPLTVPPPGDALGIIAIPRIGVNQVFVEGVDVADLRKGPGHYPSTQLPGHEGNSAIAGHRTTYGAPFGDLDQLAQGDEIDLATVQGKFKYKVTDKRVVDPNEVSVLDPIPDPAAPVTTWQR